MTTEIQSTSSPASPGVFDSLLGELSQIILGKEEQITLALACIFANGHLLIEDIPGIGKTTLAKALSKTLGLEFTRIQFTNDMLPGDIIGVQIFQQDTGQFVFHHGPIFTQVLLGDEINRATPKTQSALLEAMEERQVTVERTTYELTPPFFVIATQNPLEQAGTYSLPESQLDRFLMRISLGYPGREAEELILKQQGTATSIEDLESVLTERDVLEIQADVSRIFLSDTLVAYIQDLLEFSRSSTHFRMGLSPRAGIAITKAAQAWAFIDGRDHVLPEDVQRVLPYVAGHRLYSLSDGQHLSIEHLNTLFSEVAVPK